MYTYHASGCLVLPYQIVRTVSNQRSQLTSAKQKSYMRISHYRYLKQYLKYILGPNFLYGTFGKCQGPMFKGPVPLSEDTLKETRLFAQVSLDFSQKLKQYDHFFSENRRVLRAPHLVNSVSTMPCI